MMRLLHLSRFPWADIAVAAGAGLGVVASLVPA
jgi:hypothetical protein